MPLSVEIPFELPPPACRQPPFPEASAHVTSSDPLHLRPVARIHPPRGAALHRPSSSPGALQGGRLLTCRTCAYPERDVSANGGRWGDPRGRAGDVVAQKYPLFVLSALS
jgi:hypothetical protein